MVYDAKREEELRAELSKLKEEKKKMEEAEQQKLSAEFADLKKGRTSEQLFKVLRTMRKMAIKDVAATAVKTPAKKK